MLRLEDLAELAQSHAADLPCRVQEFSIRDHAFPFNQQPHLMGVVNLSADSWYRESVCLTTDSAIQRGRILSAQGAHIVDIGAESTLAHAARASADTQTNRLLPVVRALATSGILVSVETYSPEVARDTLEAGASVLNLTGTEHNETLYRMAAEHEATVIICYVHGRNVRDVKSLDLGTDPIPALQDFFARQIELATARGVHRILIDPGLGFYYPNLQDSATRVRHQMKIFLSTFRLRRLGFPVCHALPHAFEFFGDEVRCAEPFFAVLAALGKTDLIRTHEIPRTRAVLDTLSCF